MPRQTRETLLRSPNQQSVARRLLRPPLQPEERPEITPELDPYLAGPTKLLSSESRTRSRRTVSWATEFAFRDGALLPEPVEELGPGLWRTMESQSKYAAWFLLPAERTPPPA
jgi:hypothetical protein